MPFVKVLFSYSGRINRRTFWFKVLLPAGVLGLLFANLPVAFSLGGVIPKIGYGIVLWIVAAGIAKRLHDREHSGWLQLLVLLPATVLIFLFLVMGLAPWMAALGFVTGIIGFWIFVEVGVMRGKFGHNKFGADPFLHEQFDDNRHSGTHWGRKRARKFATRVEPSVIDEPAPRDQPDRYQPIDAAADAPAETPETPEAIAPFLNYRSGPNDDDLRTQATERPENDHAPPTGGEKPAFGFLADRSPPPANEPPPRPAPNVSQDNSPPSGMGFSTSYQASENISVEGSRQQDNQPRDKRAMVAELPRPQSASLAAPPQRDPAEALRASLSKLASDNPSHLIYLDAAAKSGNKWAKTEIAASWLVAENTTSGLLNQAVDYLREVADSQESYLGVGMEASYLLGEVYRQGFNGIGANEDLGVKFLTRAASQGHREAKYSLAALVVSSPRDDDSAEPIIEPFIDTALRDPEAASALLQMIDSDWSITYKDGVSIVLKTLVDKGDGLAAKVYGRMLMDTEQFDMAAKVLMRADAMDQGTIDRLMEIVQTVAAEDDTINALIDCLRKHATEGDSYANYHMAMAFSNGLGVPQDDLMAYVHANLAAAKVHGYDREKLLTLREDLKDNLSQDEVLQAQEIIRRHFLDR